MINYTAYVKLLCQSYDSLDYTTYVFELLDNTDINLLNEKYIMCTRWPNWDHRELRNGEIGYLSFSEIIAGEDKWFDGTNFIPYKYTTIQFNRFIEEQKQYKNEFKL